MYFKCRDVETSEDIFIDTDSDLEVGNTFRFNARNYVVLKEIDPMSKEAERISCSELKRIPRVR